MIHSINSKGGATRSNIPDKSRETEIQDIYTTTKPFFFLKQMQNIRIHIQSVYTCVLIREIKWDQNKPPVFHIFLFLLIQPIGVVDSTDVLKRYSYVSHVW